jgi:imidazolonepropionase-like amidohydrolase
MTVRDAEEGALVTRHLAEEHGVDVVKIAIETGFLSGYEEPGWPTLEPAAIQAITLEAHARSKTVHAHVTQASEVAVAIEQGCDVAAHTPIDEIPDEILLRGIRAGFIFTSTANIWTDEEHLAAVRSNLRRYTEMGGRVALGTDAPGYQPGGEMPLGELRHLASSGMSPRDVLLASTRNAAAALGAHDRVGTLQPGKLADLVIVAGDPLHDLDDLAAVVCVIADGEIVRGCDRGSRR